ncbi:MAG: quinolinate synthase NadA [Bacteroidales bacterium]|nr:quinolinate synthase NadA [Bacteroidales bacterium]
MEKAFLRSEIDRLRREKNAVIMAHYYQEKDIQEIADFIGDSLALARQAAKTQADIIVLCGVHFMGETAKIISPGKKVLIPDMAAGCSLADSCPAPALEAFIKAHPGHTVISYVNTSAAVKALTDVVVTSTNAVQIVNSFPRDEKIIFGPDRNLGSYINSLTGRQMLLWDGACHVHEQFSLDKIIALKQQYPQAELIAHPECKQYIIELSDFVGSTAALIKHVRQSASQQFIVATESGVLFEMQRLCPDKEFIPAPPEDSSCACNECSYMRLNTLEKLYLCLRDETPEIQVDKETARKALRPIQRMLDISEKNHLS